VADEPAPPVDPRFDPVFQRGYDPAVHPPVARRSVLRAPAAPPAIGLPPVPVAAPDSPAVAVEAVEADEPEPERRNPWLLALLLVSIGLLVVAGLFLWSVGQNNFYSSGTPDAAEIMIQQLAYWLPPALIVAGVLGIILRVALGAVRVARR
jgi:H+/Cl- antiporter ClcA